MSGEIRTELPASARTRLRGLATGLARWVRTTTYLRKWLFLGCLLGVIAGLGAVAFYETLTLATHLFLNDLAGYQVPTPAAEGFLPGSPNFIRPWALPLIVGFGGLLAGVLVYTLAPEAEGHGTDAAIEAVHHNPRQVRVLTVAVKIVASALTMGSGGSGGREGPTAQISAGFGSFLARVLDLSPEDGRIAVSIGIGSGIGAIFSAPLGGALLSAEILYRDDIEVEAIIPSIIASIIGYTVFGVFMGFKPLFGYAAPSYQFSHPIQLAWYALIGIVGGFIGLAYSQNFYGLMGLFKRIPVPPHFRPAIGGVMVGALAIVIPQALGTGYGWIQKDLGHQLLSLPLWLVLVVPLAKILTTSLSISSGGSGGIFGPGMVTGAFTGAAVWRLLAPIAPGVTPHPAPFVIVGMMATFGGISRAPLAIMLMVAEMTGSLTALVPAMIAVGLATLIVRSFDDTIYRAQLKNRGESAVHRFKRSMPLLGSLRVADYLAPPRVVFAGRNTVAEAADKLSREGLPGAPVCDERGVFTGVVGRERLERAAASNGDTDVARVADPTAPTITTSAFLDSALEALLATGTNWVPVLDDDRQVVGVLTTSSVVRGYRTGLRANLNQVSQVAGNTAVVDREVATGAPLAGAVLSHAGLPPGTIVMTLQRGSELLLPTGDTVLEAGDRVGILTHTEDAEVVGHLLQTGDGGADGDGGDGHEGRRQAEGSASPAAVYGRNGQESQSDGST